MVSSPISPTIPHPPVTHTLTLSYPPCFFASPYSSLLFHSPLPRSSWLLLRVLDNDVARSSSEGCVGAHSGRRQRHSTPLLYSISLLCFFFTSGQILQLTRRRWSGARSHTEHGPRRHVVAVVSRSPPQRTV